MLILVGLVASILGVLSIGLFKNLEPHLALNLSTYVAGILFVIGAYFCVTSIVGNLNIFWAIVGGLVAGMLIARESEFYTSGRPTVRVAEQTSLGAAPKHCASLKRFSCASTRATCVKDEVRFTGCGTARQSKSHKQSTSF